MSRSRAASATHHSRKAIQPAWVRIFHWFNALAVILMILSEWRIYDASPVFKGLLISARLKLGEWLGGALQWHFAAMWLLFLNGLLYLAMNLLTGRIRGRFFPARGARDLARSTRGA